MRTIIMMFGILSIFIFLTGKQIDTIDGNKRKAELRYSLNSAIEDTFKKYIVGGKENQSGPEEIMYYFNSRFLKGVTSDGKIRIRLIGLDKENGILYIGVKNSYKNVFGVEEEVGCEKALILEEL